MIRRMSLDRVMPQFFLRENRLRHTNHWIILAFFALSTSILLVTQGKLETLGGVYTLAFLSVMALFAIGNMLLKKERGRLPRDVRASWITVTVALFAVLVGVAGNVVQEPRNIGLFLLYLSVVGAVVAIMFLRIELLKLGLFVSRAIVERVKATNEWIRTTVVRKIDEINSLTVAYFTKGDDVALLNRAALYVLKNEQTKLMKVVHVYNREEDIPTDLAEQLKTIDRLYPQLRIDFLAVKGEFCPELVESLSRRLGVPKNYMFIGTPGDRFPHRIEDFGGVRVIL